MGFFDNNFQPIFAIIFSFCQDNATCMHLAMCTKDLCDVWNTMRNNSSEYLHRLKRINGEKRDELAINLFCPPFDCNSFHISDAYVSNWDKYKDNPVNSHPETEEFIQFLTKFNTQKPQVLICGGFALAKLAREGDWRHGTDIDIFLIGENEVAIAKEIVYRIGKGRRISITSGLIRMDGYPGIDIILNRGCVSISDVLSFFDLDCSKIAYVPGIGVFCMPSFVQAICTNINYCGHMLIAKGTYKRSLKYGERLSIRNSTQYPHELVRYHSFLKTRHCRDGIVYYDPFLEFLGINTMKYISDEIQKLMKLQGVSDKSRMIVIIQDISHSSISGLSEVTFRRGLSKILDMVGDYLHGYYANVKNFGYFFSLNMNIIVLSVTFLIVPSPKSMIDHPYK